MSQPHPLCKTLVAGPLRPARERAPVHALQPGQEVHTLGYVLSRVAVFDHDPPRTSLSISHPIAGTAVDQPTGAFASCPP